MLRSCVRQVRIEEDFGIAVSEQPTDQHAQNLSADTTVLTVGLADINADCCDSIRHIAVIALANQTVVFLNNQKTVSKSFLKLLPRSFPSRWESLRAITAPSFHQAASCFASAASAWRIVRFYVVLSLGCSFSFAVFPTCRCTHCITRIALFSIEYSEVIALKCSFSANTSRFPAFPVSNILCIEMAAYRFYGF